MSSVFRSSSRRLTVSWFRIEEVADQIYAIEEPGHVQSYLVNGRCRSALIDTGLGLAPLGPALGELARPEIVVLNTHWHFDHVMGNPAFASIAIASEEDLLTPLPGDAGIDLAARLWPERAGEIRCPE